MKNKKLAYCLVAAVVIVLVGGAAFAFMQINKTKDEESQTTTSLMTDGKLGYEGNIVLNKEDDLQALVDGMVEKAEEGQMALEFKNTAISTDGKKFSCYIANSIKNNYDMFLALYTDDTLQEEMMLTGLIPSGSGIETFEVNNKLEPGTYDTRLVLTQVEADRATIHSQLVLAFELIVK